MDVFTTGQAARICNVAPRTVSKWFDSKRLKGYRIPGSQDRRIPKYYLIRFLKDHGMPLGNLDDYDRAKVLIVAHQVRDLVVSLNRAMYDQSSFLVRHVQDRDSALPIIGDFWPNCVLLDVCSLGIQSTLEIATEIHENRAMQSTVLIGLHSDQSDLRHGQFTELFRKPFDVDLLATRVRTLTAELAA